MNTPSSAPGFAFRSEGGGLRVRMAATLDNIDRAVDAAQDFLLPAEPGQEELFGAMTALREGVLNAVKHGCRTDPALTVEIDIDIDGDEMRAQVRDPGPGFDWCGKTPGCLPEAEAQSGRGLPIMNHYATHMAYNTAGNILTFRVALRQRRKDMSQTAPEATALLPDGDIVASRAEDLKARIREALQATPGSLVIDMRSVRQIDSVGLGLLIATHNTLQAEGGKLALAGVTPDILRLLKAMRLDRHFALTT